MAFDCLKSMLSTSPLTFLVIDALDECPERVRAESLLPFLRDLVALDIGHLRVLVTSRPDPDIRVCMDVISTYSLDLGGVEERVDDLARYIDQDLYGPKYGRWVNDIRLRGMARSMLNSKASGM
jgi:hypothetical protein